MNGGYGGGEGAALALTVDRKSSQSSTEAIHVEQEARGVEGAVEGPDPTNSHTVRYAKRPCAIPLGENG